MSRINKKNKLYFLPLICFGLFFNYLSAQNENIGRKEAISVKATLDSAYIEMGRITSLHVEIVGNLNENGGILLPDTLWQTVEIADPGAPVLKDLGNGRKELTQDIILQAFDSGFYTLPPVLYMQGDQVYESNRPALKVIPVEIDTLRTIHDIYDVQEADSHFFDFLPDWLTDYGLWILLGLLASGALIAFYFMWYSKGKIPFIPTKKPIPPYELAISRLNALHTENLCEKGQEKEFYTRLVDILRNYIDSRFGINAMEMTSAQILSALRNNETTKLPEKYISRVLEIADFVKFAKVRPLPEDNASAFKSAVQFVEDTKPSIEEITENQESQYPETKDKQ